MSFNNFKINGRMIGSNQPPYIIAELSANHGGSLKRAKKIIKLSKQSGADAIKLQVYGPESLTIKCKEKDFIIGKNFNWKNKNLYDLYKSAQTPKKWVPELLNYSKKIGITVFATPFDIETVKFLNKLGVPAFKISSFEANYHDLIIECVKTRKPVIISTGMCKKKEIQEIVNLVKKNGGIKLALLKCTSSYPAKLNEINLSVIPHMKKNFNTNIGFSDHTLGIESSILAIGYGACIIEKHFIDKKKPKTPDSFFSILPHELKSLVKRANEAYRLKGYIKYGPTKIESESMVFRRSIYCIKDIMIGEKLTKANIAIIRPGKGLDPKFFNKIIGKKTKKKIIKGPAIKLAFLK